MTVAVQCFHCNAILELDEGFRGGVCRCSNCGSLLQVPKSDGPAVRGKKVRPAMPPAARTTAPAGTGQGAAAQAAKAGTRAGTPGDSGALQSPFDPRRPGVDTGGSSSGLGHIHKTQPVEAPAPAALKSRHSADSSYSTSLPSARSVAGPGGTGQLPQLRAIRRNTTLFWVSVLLILLLAAAIIALLALYIYHGP